MREDGKIQNGMKKVTVFFLIVPLLLMVCACDYSRSKDNKTKKEAKEMTGITKETWTLDGHGPVYVYLPDDVKANQKLPLILDMNCTGGNPQAEVVTNGWDQVAERERLIIVAPTYDDYVTYSEVSYMNKVLDEAISRYHPDTTRVYATGFSNGGALSVALASESPKRFAALSAAGWMVGARHTNHGYLMPFQLLQGTQEYTEKDKNGHWMIMDDEREAIADLFKMNGMNRGQPDYQKTPYWGYAPDYLRTIYPKYTDYDLDGKNPKKRSNVAWHVSDYDKSGYTHPFAQFVLIDDAAHVPHDYHATIAWDFLKHFKRNNNGKLVEVV